MNILFLVMSFLLVFMFISGSVLKNAKYSSESSSFSISLMQSQIHLLSKWERYKFDTYAKEHKTKKEKLGPKKAKEAPKKRPTFKSHRTKQTIHSQGKWNLAPLYSARPGAEVLLCALSQNLLKELYSHTFFWKELEEKGIDPAEALLSSFTENRSNPESLYALFPADPILQQPFYKMLKGSGRYDIEKKLGYPPLRDFFTFRVKDKALVHFPFAAKPILHALFQESVVESIMDQEKKKWDVDQYLHSLNLEELRTLCLGSFLSIKGRKFQDLEPYLDFSAKKAPLETLIQNDDKTHLHLEMPLPHLH